MDNISFRKLLDKRIKEKYTSQEHFAKALGATQATISRYISGKTLPSFKKLQKIYELLEIDSSMLDNKITNHNNQVISIPFYYSEVSAGVGITSLEDNYDNLYFDELWIKNQFLLKNINDLFCVKVKGDSMYPIIQEGDIVFAKKYDYTQSSQSIYIVQYNNDYFIKKIQFKSKNELKLISTNKDYDPINIDLSNETISFNIVANVVGKISMKSFSKYSIK